MKEYPCDTVLEVLIVPASEAFDSHHEIENEDVSCHLLVEVNHLLI